jgi:GTP-binding protein LepA
MACVYRVSQHQKEIRKHPLQAMIFDSVFNSFRGIEIYFRVFNGTMKKGEKVKFISTGQEYGADEIGVLKLDKHPRNEIAAGNVGLSYLRNKSGQRSTCRRYHYKSASNPGESVRGFEKVKPMVFAGIYPVDTTEFEELRASMEKLEAKRCFVGVGA